MMLQAFTQQRVHHRRRARIETNAPAGAGESRRPLEHLPAPDCQAEVAARLAQPRNGNATRLQGKLHQQRQLAIGMDGRFRLYIGISHR